MITVQGPVLLDLNTQRDLFTPDGAYPVLDGEKRIDPIKKLFTWAARQQVPVVSTRLHGVVAPDPRMKIQRTVCVEGTPGCQKMPGTLLRRRKEFPLDCGTSLPVEGFKATQQFVFDLVSLNPFECPRLDRLMSESEISTWLIFGAPLEWAVRTSVLGLLQRRQKVAVISDALGMWDPYEGDMALRQIESKNIEWLTAAEAMEKYAPKPVRRTTETPTRPVARPDRPATSTPKSTQKGKSQPSKLPKREYRMS